MPSSASGWERYARPTASPGRTGLHWASGGGTPASLLLYQGGLLSSQEREVGRVDSVAGPSLHLLKDLDGSKDCVRVCSCVHVSANICDPLLTTGRPHVHIRENGFSKSPAFSFSVFSLESAWVDGLAHTWWFLCVPALTLGLQGPVWQLLATSGYLMKH